MPEIGLLGQEYYLRMPRAGGPPTLHALHSPDPMQDVAADHPAETARMQKLCRGLYETARYMLRHNAPGVGEPGGTAPAPAR